MKIPGPKGVITVRGEQSSDRKTLYRHETKCTEKGEASKSVHMLSGTGESKTDHSERYIPKPLPEGELKEIRVSDNDATRIVKIGADLSIELQKKLIDLL